MPRKRGSSSGSGGRHLSSEPTSYLRPVSDPVEIDLRADLWKYAQLIMSVSPHGRISTAEMIAKMPGYVQLSDDHTAANASQKDSKFPQIVRNLKAHKNTKTNFIYKGYA